MANFNVEENKRFSDWFESEREKYKWSIRRACREAGFTHPYIIKIRSGEQPVTYNVVEGFANAFKQPVTSVWEMIRGSVQTESENLDEQIKQEVSTLPESSKREVLDFIRWKKSSDSIKQSTAYTNGN